MRAIAEFIGVGAEAALIARVAEASSFDKMKSSAEEEFDRLAEKFGRVGWEGCGGAHGVRG